MPKNNSENVIMMNRNHEKTKNNGKFVKENAYVFLELTALDHGL